MYNIIMLSTKNYNNNSSLSCTTGTFKSIYTDLITVGSLIEAVYIPPPNFNYVLDYSLSNKFYLTDYNISTLAYNYRLLIKNIPTDNNIYTLTLYTHTTNGQYCDTLKVFDTDGNYILGDDTTYAAPLFESGIPNLYNNRAAVIIQEFSIVPVYAIPIYKVVVSNVKSNHTGIDLYSYLMNNFYNTSYIDGLMNNFYNKTYIDTISGNIYLNYYTKTQSDNNYYNKTYINTLSGNLYLNYYNKTQVDTQISTSNYFKPVTTSNNALITTYFINQF